MPADNTHESQSADGTGDVPRSTIGGISWNAIGQFGSQGLRTAQMLVLSVFLFESDFGKMAIVALLFGLTQILVDLGTGQALVQTASPSRALQSSVLQLNLLIGLLVAPLVFALSGVVARIMDDPDLEAVIEACAPAFVLAATYGVQVAMLNRAMRFRAIAIVQLSGVVLGCAVTILGAASGWGVWALVTGFYVEMAWWACGYWIAAPWRPSLGISLEVLRPIRSFSVNLAGCNLVNFGFEQFDTAVVGSVAGTDGLGFYWFAKKVIVQPTVGFMVAVQGVLFAQFSRIQGDTAALRQKAIKATVGTCLLLFPFVVGAALVAHDAVLGLVGERWAAVPMLIVLLSPLGIAAAVSASSGALFRALGKTNQLFRWGIVRGCIVAAGIAIGTYWGLQGVAAGLAVATVVVLVPTLWIPFRWIVLPLGALARALLPVVYACAWMAACVLACRWALDSVDAGSLVKLFVCVPVGACAYLFALERLRPAEYSELRSAVLRRFARGQRSIT